MNVTRRKVLQLLAATAPGLALRKALAKADGGQASIPPASGISITPGPFTDTRASLEHYATPAWFADAKFGIWSHWGPQSAVGDGDWYARQMYVEGSEQYNYHRKRFGPQCAVGYKDLIPLFTASEWDPNYLMGLYQEAGAKYFFSMGVHHDNYDLWNSKYQPRWNSVVSGPRKDVVGLWAAAARERGLRFGVSEHLSNSFDWFAPSHLADTRGSYAKLPYDGQNPAFADLYHSYADMPANFAETAEPMGRVAPEWWKLQYFNRVKDLIDQHQPDLLYTDGGIEFGRYGLATVAELYNVGPTSYSGLSEAVYFSKTLSDCGMGTCVIDRERQVTDSIAAQPWQTDTCIGQWHYKVGQVYKTPKKVIDLLVDIVSKNGNLLLSIPLPASGQPDAEELRILASISQWMQINGEAIYATRPWVIYGEGPATKVVVPTTGTEFNPNEDKKPDLTFADVRFTTKGKTLYALVQGWPTQTGEGRKPELLIRALGVNSPQQPEKAVDIRLLGRDEPLRFTQDFSGLRVILPAARPLTADIGVALRIRFA